MALDTMTPAADWALDDHRGTVKTLSGLDAANRILVWCDDGCKDCWELLPDFAAALEAAGVPDAQVVQYAVERLPEGRKRGPQVEAYGIERIPTVVVERDGTEVARFVEGEGEGVAIAESVARQLAATDVT